MASSPARRGREASTSATHSGKLLLRMPPTLHARLADEAERHGVSLNQLITTRLEESVTGSGRARGARPGTAGTTAEVVAPPASPTSRLTSFALGVNLVVVVVAGVIAIVLLVVALAAM